MNCFKVFLIAAVAVACLTMVAPQLRAEVGVGISIGAAPSCPYGYYPDSPYECAPYGYYGPEWFTNGVFIGAGPWWHGEEHFRGHIDRDFDRHNFRGHRPERGERAEWENRRFDNFHGNVIVNGRGEEMRERERGEEMREHERR